MLLYDIESTIKSEMDERCSYPKLRSDFRPPAFVMLTREDGARWEDRHV